MSDSGSNKIIYLVVYSGIVSIRHVQYVIRHVTQRPLLELLSCTLSLSGVPDFCDRNKILSGGDLSHYQVPHYIRVFFYFVWFVFIRLNFQFYFELCTYCNILDIYLS